MPCQLSPDVSSLTHHDLVVGDMADLIFVFFDPIGQALCKRTLNLVEHLNEKHSEIMRYYLSKADEAGHESDRQVSTGSMGHQVHLHFSVMTGIDIH